MKTRLQTFTLIALVLTSGCASVSFKRGASGEAMAQDERACRENPSGMSYDECMRKRGSYVGGKEVAPAPRAPTPMPEVKPVPPAEPTVPPVVPNPSPAAALPQSAPPPPTPTPVAPEPVADSPAPQRGEPAAPAESKSDVGTTYDPLALVKVETWWKLGGTPDGLESSIDGCVKKLGAQHRPDANARIVTAAMRDCLLADGWKGYAAATGSQ